MELSRHKRRILADMGIPLWRARASADTGAAPEASPEPPPESRAGLTVEQEPRESSVAATGIDWQALHDEVAGCTACSELVASRRQTVFGVGDTGARWLFVGEAPGAEEDRRGEPFVGRAGQLLDNMLAALGLDREHDVFIANILKCRPPNNRDPKPEEARACRGFLDRQIEAIAPEVIVALGRVPAHQLLETETAVGRLRGRVHEYRGIPLVVTWHPAYLLRSPREKARAWEDLQRARACLPSAATD
ncbi:MULTISPECIES: uracil-DNA glycosylase family protein [unclassified Thioalkalivibrio]|uniref:uracil-DNA glycosylase n=1 Tax=unclassified Thioalkalivibrio TaxID=2621013 RepID=UPI00035F12E9|nr:MULTISPECIES: uracil-DNA glycosylase [unclassified Thioalkalivibrio]